MSINRYAKRRDANEREIIDALEAIGCTVAPSDVVDLLVGRAGQTYLLEVKDGDKSPSRRKLTPSQKKLQAGWKGHYAVVKSVEEALTAVQPLMYKGVPVFYEQLRSSIVNPDGSVPAISQEPNKYWINNNGKA